MISIRSAIFPIFLQILLLLTTAVGQQNPLPSLVLGQNQEHELPKNQSQKFSLSLIEGQYALLIVEQRQETVAVIVLDANGKEVAKGLQPFFQPTPIHLGFIAPASGEYRVDIRNTSEWGASSYRIRLEHLRQAEDRDRQLAQAYRDFYGVVYKLIWTSPNTAYSELAETLRALLPIWRERGDQEMEAATLLRIAAAYEHGRNTLQAIDYFRQAERLTRLLPEQPGLAMMLASLGQLYASIGELKLAEEMLREASVRVGEDLGNKNWILNASAIFQSHIGNQQQAIEIIQQALAISRKANSSEREAVALNILGFEYRRLGDAERAEEYFRQVIPLSRVAKYPELEASCLINLGEVKLALGQVPAAIELTTQGLELARSNKDRSREGFALMGLGRIHFQSRQFAEAEINYQQALKLAREAGVLRGEMKALLNLGRLYRVMGKKQEAIARLKESLALTIKLGDVLEESSVRYELALVERDLGKLDSAQEGVESAINRIESLRAKSVAQDLRTYFLSSVREMYETKISLLMERHRLQPDAGHDALALQASERARARGLIELLAESNTNIREGVNPALLQGEQSVRLSIEAKVRREIALLNSNGSAEELATLKKEIANLTEEASQIEARIRAESPRYASLVMPEPLGLAEIQKQALDDQTLLLEYALGEERSYLFAVTQTVMVSYELPKRADIEIVARRVNELMRLRPENGNAANRLRRVQELEVATRQLSEMILRPVAAQLSNRRLLIVADGALRYVPFAALPDPEASGQIPTPLIVKHQIASIPSATTLAVLRRELNGRQPATQQLAVLADPVFGVYDDRVLAKVKGRQPEVSPSSAAQTLAELERGIREDGRGLRLARLPFSRQEADAIALLGEPANSTKLLDFRANRETVINASLASYRYIHLATHGLLNGYHPELSGLFLSLVNERGELQNGLLRVGDIYNLKLPVEMVVLSACETALGKDVKGEGIVGLTRGFMYAGARRVVASLWKVNDASTAELMKRFYQGMLGQKKLSPAAALREAQVSMCKEQRWQSPYYWAAFVLQGEW